MSKYLKTLFYLNMTMWHCLITYFIIFSGISYLSVSFHVILLSANDIIMIVKIFNTSFVVHTLRYIITLYWIKANYDRFRIELSLELLVRHCISIYFISLAATEYDKGFYKVLISKRHIYTITFNSHRVTLIKIHIWKFIFKPSL